MAMPPEARQNFQRNAERWLRMSPAERNVMRQRENLRRETIRRETDAALRDSGLKLNPQERAQFESRYIQERRKVERNLRQQIEAERQQELPALIQQLKKEFQIDQPAKGSATKPSESAKPKK
jgi:predicted metal-dependent hydrolase